MSFAKKALTSAAWSFSTGYANMLIGFLGNLVLARTLQPEDFGGYALASSVLVFVTMFTGFGSQEAIMQCRDESIVDLKPTAFWISLGIGVVVSIAGVITGLAVWTYYGRIIALIIIILSILVPFTSIANAHASVLRRDMMYKAVGVTLTISSIASFILAIIAAFFGIGAWALVIKQCSAELLYWLGMRVSSSYRLEKKYNKEAASWIWKFGWKNFFLQVNNIIFGYFDNLMVGTFIGNSQLGYYSQSYRLALLGQQFTQGTIAPILLPMFATVQFSAEKLRYGFERVFYWTCRVVPLLGAVIFLSGKNIVILLYGQKWTVAGQYFQMMFLLFMFLPLAATLGSFFIGSGNIDKSLKIRSIQVAVFVVGVTLGAIQKNINWVIWTANLNYVLAVLMMGYAARRIIPIDWLYLCGVPTLAFVLIIAIGSWLAPMISDSFLGTLLFVLIVTLLYLTLLVFLEYRSLRREFETMLKISRRD